MTRSQPTRADARVDHPVAVVAGTRPEAIKLAGVVDLLGASALVVWTGQHYDADLFDCVVRDVGLGEPHLALSSGSAPRGLQVATVLSGLDAVFAVQPPSCVVVQGDTNSALAGALAANARSIPLVHVEAGLRSYDRRMPEEHNRVVIDHLADLLCAPTEVSRANLLREGIADDSIAVTGNTIVESVRRLLPQPRQRVQALQDLGLRPRGYVLATLHRPENTDDPLCLGRVLDSLAALDVPVLIPMHPRTHQRALAAGLSRSLERLRVTSPLPPTVFLGLAADARLLVSDSGGLQEEASVLRQPLVVLRRSTERSEVMGTFAELMTPGRDLPARLADAVARSATWRRGLRHLPTPYGDGQASRRTVDALADLVSRHDAGPPRVPSQREHGLDVGLTPGLLRAAT
jgi:UDP-N-acetylglucosamine 2-epimerase (non-hydrolysing)